MRIKAAVLDKIGLPPPYARSRPLEVAELDLAPPGRGEVLVRVSAAGLCHSDLSVIDGSRPRPTPMALGHEAAGIVEALGEGACNLAVGDHVVLVFVPSCGRCGPCAAGRPALCEPGAKANGVGTLLSGERRLSFRAQPVNHHLGVSAFATYAVVARESCVKINPDLPFELGALFGCAVLTGFGAVVNTARVEPSASVAVVGLGGVGLSAVLGAKLATVTAGLPHPDRRMALAPVTLVAEERTLKGSYIGSAAPLRDVPRYIALFKASRLPVDALLTHRLKLEEINEGFDRLREGIGVRQVVE